MKKLSSLLLALLLIIASIPFSMSVMAESYSQYTVPYAVNAPTIDGVISSGEWDAAEWANIAYGANEGYSTGKFKVMHDDQYIYMLFDVVDPNGHNDWDSIGLGFSDVRESNVSGAEQIAPNNTFSFRHGLNGEQWIGNDLHRDKILTEARETVFTLTENGYLLETKLEYIGGVPGSVYFQALLSNQPGDLTTFWNEHWSSRLVWQTTKCYGELIFAPKPVNYSSYAAPYATTPPTIDGTISLDEWDAAEWSYIANSLDSAKDLVGSAKFKIMHDGDYVYALFEVEDDTHEAWDSVGLAFSDVRSENTAGASTIGPNNIISYRPFGGDSIVIANDKGTDGKPAWEGGVARDCADLVKEVETNWVATETGYLIETKLEYIGGVPGNIYFQATYGNQDKCDAIWNEYWGWNITSFSTRCFGQLSFAAKPVTYSDYSVAFATKVPTIDGSVSVNEWDAAEWAYIANSLDSAKDVVGSAKFKIMHDGDYVYVLFEVEDDTHEVWDSVGLAFSDVRSENTAGASTIGPNNIIGYRPFGGDSIVIANDKGTDGKPAWEGGVARDCVDLVKEVETNWVATETGYLIETKLEYIGGVPENIYFQATYGNQDKCDAVWNEYWGWNITSFSTRCFGQLSFAPVVEAPEAPHVCEASHEGPFNGMIITDEGHWYNCVDPECEERVDFVAHVEGIPCEDPETGCGWGVEAGSDVYTVTLQTTGATVDFGGKVYVSVFVDGGITGDFAAAELKFAYDSAKLRFLAENSTLGTATVALTENGLFLADYGESKMTGNGSVYVLCFEAIEAGDCVVSVTEAGFSDMESASTEDLNVADFASASVSLHVNPATVNVTFDDIFSGNTSVVFGNDYTFAATDATNYTYKNVVATMAGANVEVIDNGDGTYTVKNVTGELVITGTRTAKTYDVTINDEAAEDATYGVDYVITLPDDVAVDGATPGTQYTLGSITIGDVEYKGYALVDRTVTIPGTAITGDIVVTINATTVNPDEYTVTVNKDSAVGDLEYEATAIAGVDYTFSFNGKGGFTYTVTAKVGGTEVTVTSAQGGTWTIAAADVKGNIEITITATLNLDGVAVGEYLQLDGTKMWIVSIADWNLEDGYRYTYNGEAMYIYNGKVVYLVVADSLTVDAAKALIGVEDGAAATLVATNDINGTGTIDANDAQFVYNMYNAMYSDFSNVSMEKFLLADVNNDGMLNTADAVAIVAGILN